MALPVFARALALIIALFALASLALRFVVIHGETGGVVSAIWHLARYFTILTNALAVALFAHIAWTGRIASERWLAGLILWVSAAGLIYHWLLSQLWEPEGLTYIADQGLHTVVPTCAFAWWLLFGCRTRLSVLDPFFWLSWPVLYLIYALTRSAFDGIYAYPFLDPSKVAPSQVVWTLARLLEGFTLLGYGLLLVSRLRTWSEGSEPDHSASAK